MSSRSVSDFVLEAQDFNRLAQVEESPKPYVDIWDIREVDAAEVKARLLWVPETLYHVVVELEDGTDYYISFNRRYWQDRDDLHIYEGVELYDLHLDGIPVEEDDMDFLFEEGIEELENFIWELEGQE
jgi:hypothetical protein